MTDAILGLIFLIANTVTAIVVICALRKLREIARINARIRALKAE